MECAVRKHQLFIYLPLIILFAVLSASAEKTKEPDLNTNDQTKGGINDLNAIGNRNVGCARGVGNWYTLDKQVAMGKAYAQQVESTAKIINDPVISEYINRLGQNLVRNSDAKVPFTIKVIDSDEVNAFALPGGFFYVNSGLILAADNEAQLAGVMAHEIAHVAACHAAREQTRGELANLATIPLIFVGGGYGVYAAEEAASMAIPVAFMKFSRGFEAQADYLGLEYMYKAGYDPEEFIAMFEKIEAQEKKKPGFIAKAFETHPPTPDRIEKSQEEIAKVLPKRRQYIVDTSEFDSVKARLAEIENGHRLENKHSNRPTLRRAQQPTHDDGPPVLKRRSDDGSSNGS
jgi:predicted Zn-dependent protease